MSADIKKVLKEFKISSLAVDNKTTVYVLAFMITVLGLIAYTSMPIESFPEVKLPTIYVGTSHPGNSPLDMENLITRPIEKEINTITGVDKITSTSIQDYSTIIVEFNTDVAVKDALQDVKDAVDKAKKDLPSDLDRDPNIFELDFSEFPIMNINLSADMSIDRLKEFAELLEDDIEKLTEISKVEIRGTKDKEVKIEVDLHKMAALNITFQDIENAIGSENVTISGGNILVDGLRRTIRVVGEFTDMTQIENIVVKYEKQDVVHLKDIAHVEFGYEEPKSFARLNKNPVVMLDVIKSSGENLIEASKKINQILENAKDTYLPKNLSISITNDQSDMTVEQVDSLENSIVFGVILVILVLLFFLGSRNAIFVGIAIPLSMFMAFMVLGALGVTINMMVLFGLIMALGMLVDNGIVIVENIYRLMDEGLSPLQAAKQGAGEVAWPIISSTATTLAAFLPLAFWPGLMGQFMQYLPITLIIVLGSSLFVALVINPVLTSQFMIVGTREVNKKKLNKFSLVIIGVGILFYLIKAFTFGNLLVITGLITLLNIHFLTPASNKFQLTFFPKLEARYNRFLSYVLSGKNPRKFFFGTIGLLVLSFVLLGVFTPKVLFFPENEPNYVNVFIEMPQGTDIYETDKIAREVETSIIDKIEKYGKVVESVITQVGEGTSDPNEGPSQGVTPHKSRITAAFVKYNDRDGVSTTEILKDIRAAVRGKFPGVIITVEKNVDGPPVGKPINIEISGEEFADLIELSADVMNVINQANIDGIEELKMDLEVGKPEMIVDIDREKARRFGLSTYRVASEIRTALFGKEVSKYKLGEDDYPIQLRLQDKYRYDKEALMNQDIIYRDQTNGAWRQIPVSAIASSSNNASYGSVKRKDLDRVVTVYSNVIEGYNPTEVVNNIKKSMADYKMPKGYDLKFTGEQENQEKEMAFLSKALLLAVFLIFLIIVAQFNSVATPFIIMCSVIFSTIGVFLGLVTFQMDFVIMMTMIGIISLAGVVVNNAIVLIDYTKLIERNKKIQLGIEENKLLSDEEQINAIIEGGKTRLRPVLLTAITTVLGLVPLAVGININFFTLLSDFDPQFSLGGDSTMFWGPMSWTIIFGLTFATFLTLVIVPVMYLFAQRLKRRIVR